MSATHHRAFHLCLLFLLDPRRILRKRRRRKPPFFSKTTTVVSSTPANNDLCSLILQMRGYMQQKDETNGKILCEIDEIKKLKKSTEDHFALMPRSLDFATPPRTIQHSKGSGVQYHGGLSSMKYGSSAMTQAQGSYFQPSNPLFRLNDPPSSTKEPSPVRGDTWGHCQFKDPTLRNKDPYRKFKDPGISSKTFSSNVS
ncbi:hypothetical protein Hanom_Chr02g00125081 [Helianthus anomalus]